jgi:hypothetical protein
VGVVLLAPHGDQIKYMVHLDFKATNNMTEYEALLVGLSITLSPTIWLMAAPELPCVLRTGSAGRKQINKYSLTTRPS